MSYIAPLYVLQTLHFRTFLQKSVTMDVYHRQENVENGLQCLTT